METQEPCTLVKSVEACGMLGHLYHSDISFRDETFIASVAKSTDY